MVLLVAFARPLWAAALHALRQLTRLAVTALVLVVGSGGVATAPTTAAPQPTVVTSRVAEVRVDRATVPELAADPTGRAIVPPVRQQARPAAAPRPATAVTPADPGRDALGRRGPPSA